MLHVPPEDKNKAEHLSQYALERILIWPVLLTDACTKPQGWETAVSSHSAPGSASICCVAGRARQISRGYVNSRQDVGGLVAKQAVQGPQWVNKSAVISSCVNLC